MKADLRFVFIVFAVLAGVFFAGRFSAPTKTVTVEKRVEVMTESKVESDHSKKKTVRVEKYEHGKIKEVTIEDILQNSIDISNELIRKNEEEKVKTEEKKRHSVIINAIGSMKSGQINYGGSVQYRAFGPVHIGAAYVQTLPFMASVGIEL